jgi:hypothetical protein
MTFVPLQLKKIPGIEEGEEFEYEACAYADRKKDDAKYTTFTVKQYKKTADAILTALGWN